MTSNQCQHSALSLPLKEDEEHMQPREHNSDTTKLRHNNIPEAEENHVTLNRQFLPDTHNARDIFPTTAAACVDLSLAAVYFAPASNARP